MPLSQATIIAVAAGSGAAALLLFLIAWRCFRRPKQPVPLPPKQELRYSAYPTPHHTETWYDSGKLSAPPSPFGGSRSSLVPPPSRGESRRSFYTSESPSEELSLNVPPLPLAPSLALPHPSFDTSSTSLSTSETDWSPHATDSSISHVPRFHPHRASTSSSRPGRRPRPLSVGSSSAMSRNSRSYRGSSVPHTPTRGVPHGPHSTVQIVLPTPLGLNDGASIHDQQSRRYSVVDQWAAPPALRSSEPNPIPKPHGRPSSISGPRRSSSHSSVQQRPQRNSSVPRPPASPSSWVPPVPELPANVISERGRSRDVAAERVPVHADRPTPPPKQTLQKRSRSRGR